MTTADPVGSSVLAVASRIGSEYLSAGSAPMDAEVVVAYQHLQAETDHVFKAGDSGQGANSVRIVFTRCPEPHGSDRELIAAVDTSRVLEITTGAISSERLHPLLGCEFAGAFDRFRAVHDLIGHARSGLGFKSPRRALTHSLFHGPTHRGGSHRAGALTRP